MTKTDVIDFFGDQRQTANAFRVSVQSVSQWPETFSERLTAETIGTAIRDRGVRATRAQWPGFFQRAA